MYPLLLRLSLTCIGSLLALSVLSSLRGSSIRELVASYTWAKSPGIDVVLNDASNTTLGFQKILVIDTSSQPEIRDAVSLAAALTPNGGLKIEYVDNNTAGGAKSSSIVEDPLRGHMDALRTIVEQKISSALVLEAGMEWSENIKKQMQDFASAARTVVQPELSDKKSISPTSPYGDLDFWDTLFLNYCGIDTIDLDMTLGAGKVIIRKDTSEPEHAKTQHAEQQPDDGRHELKRGQDSESKACPLAYGVTQRGARRFLLSLMERPSDYTMNSVMHEVCDGYAHGPEHNCIVSDHQIFQTRGLKSDRGEDWQYHELGY